MTGNLLFVGFHGTADRATPESQNELVAALLADSGYQVRSGSAEPRQLLRLADQLRLVVTSLRWADVAILCQFSGRRGWTPYLVTRLTRRAAVPTVIVLRGGGLPEDASSHPRRVDTTLDLATRVIAPSAYLQRAFTARGHRVIVLPNLVRMPPTASHDPIDPSAPRILWMRAFHPTYQPELAVDAFARLLDTVPGSRLTMAGPDRGLLSATREQVDALGITDQVTFPGYLEGEGKVDAFAAHDLFLNTTRVDNSPVSVLEAMAASLPVVATDVGGLRDLATAEGDALLVPDGDPAALAEAMGRVVADEVLATQLRRGGHRIASHHGADQVRKAWEDVLGELGAPAEGPPGDGCGPLAMADLDEVVAIHRAAFPDSGMSLLGPRVVKRYYRWQFSGPHPEPVALGSWRDGRLVGFLVGGARREAITGFVRSSLGALGLAAASHPLFVRRLALPKVWTVAKTMVRNRRNRQGRRNRRGRPPEPRETATPPAVLAPSFGVLSVAVADPWQGTGVADELLEAAEREARHRGFAGLNLSVNVDNDRAVRFYEKHGWQRSAASPWDGKMAKMLADDDQAHVGRRSLFAHEVAAGDHG